VQPVSSGSGCLSPISECAQIVRSTPQDGQLEFVLFFMNGNLGSGDCLERLQTVLSWPPEWELVGGEQCLLHHVVGLEEEGGSLGADGTTLGLDLWWSGHPLGVGYGAVVPLVRLVMNVVGEGRLGFSGPGEAVLRSDCQGPTFVTYPVQVFAEAGVQCGHLTAQCGWYTVCEPEFHHPELVLSAPTGGAADTTFSFLVAAYWQTCSLVVDTHTPWCTAWVEPPNMAPWLLHVTADATGLPPGTYETAMEVISSSYGVSRCLPTTFIVEGTTATPPMSWPMSWGRVKSLYR
jgi:hypothetical protein